MFTNRNYLRARIKKRQGKKFFPGHYITATPLHTHGMPAVGTNDDVNIRQFFKDKTHWRGYNNLYYWGILEPQKGVYDFSKILEDLDRTVADGKVMGISIEDRTFNSGRSDLLPSYLTEDPIYSGGYYVDSAGVFPKVWIPSVGDRMVALLQAMGAAVDSHPALAAVSFQETAMPGGLEQPGYDATEYYLYLKKIHSAAAAAFPRTPVAQTANWFAGMTSAQAEDFITHLVENCGGGFGAADIIGSNPATLPPPTYALDNGFGKLGIYSTYRGVAPIITRAETATYYGSDSAQTPIDYAVDVMGAHIVSWQPIRGIAFSPQFTVYDVDAALELNNGRINSTTPTALMDTA